MIPTGHSKRFAALMAESRQRRTYVPQWGAQMQMANPYIAAQNVAAQNVAALNAHNQFGAQSVEAAPRNIASQWSNVRHGPGWVNTPSQRHANQPADEIGNVRRGEVEAHPPGAVVPEKDLRAAIPNLGEPIRGIDRQQVRLVRFFRARIGAIHSYLNRLRNQLVQFFGGHRG